MWKLHRVDIWAVIIAVAGVSLWTLYDQSLRSEMPATDWFVVKNISVPDFEEGGDPIMLYDREIKKPFTGTWSVEVHGATESTNYSVCTGSGTNRYKPGESLPERGVKLSWFLGKICDLPPGQYSLEVDYELRASRYPSKYYSATSNIFNVIPRGAQLFLEEEQVEQLKKAQDLLNNPLLQQFQKEPQ